MNSGKLARRIEKGRAPQVEKRGTLKGGRISKRLRNLGWRSCPKPIRKSTEVSQAEPAMVSFLGSRCHNPDCLGLSLSRLGCTQGFVKPTSTHHLIRADPMLDSQPPALSAPSQQFPHLVSTQKLILASSSEGRPHHLH